MNVWIRSFFVVAFVVSFSVMLFTAEAVAATEQARASVVGKVVMPAEIPEGIDVEGLSLKDAVVMLKGKGSYPRMPYPANWQEMTREERGAWLRAYEKTEAYEDYTRRVEEAEANRPIFTTELADDGSFRFDGIKPAWYQFSVQIMHPGAGDKISYELARAHVSHGFTIKQAKVPTNLGTKTLKLKNVLMPGDTAPDWTAKAYDGSEIKLSDFRGKYVLMDFWAVWCGPCKAEFPNLEAAYKKHGGDRFEMVGLSLDETIDLPKAYHKENPSPYVHAYLGNWGKTETTARDYGVMGIPSIWLIGPDGKIIARDLRGKALREAVDKALQGNAGIEKS